MTDPTTGEIVTYWRQIIGTLGQRNLLRRRAQQGGFIIPEADAYLFTDRAIFVLDMQRLGGISREAWTDRRLWAQWVSALAGRRVFVSDGGGLAICVAREPGTQSKRLPAVIPLTLEDVPPEPYQILLGHSKRGSVFLDLAGDNRAILIGGTSGSGKTNLMQSIILQLAAKHTPGEVEFAVVDTKEVDFSAHYEQLPHLPMPIARSLQDANSLIQSVDGIRLVRQRKMYKAGVSDWRGVSGLGLFILVIDEAADFAKTTTMDIIVEIARKGRAMGVSIVLGTQSPTSKVVDPQVRANLPTAIAFQTRTDIESRVILGRSGAEKLRRPGLCLSFLDGRWQEVQAMRVNGAAALFVDHVAAPPSPTVGEIESDLVRYAVEHLDRAFIIGKLYDAFGTRISKRRLTALGQQWQARGWLTRPAHAADPRRVTATLLELAGVSPGVSPDVSSPNDTYHHVSSVSPYHHPDNTGEGDIPAFLAGRRQAIEWG